MLVIATSASGTLEKDDAVPIEKYSATRDHKIKFFNPADEMRKVAAEERIEIDWDYILNAPEDTLTLLRRIALSEKMKEDFRECDKRGDAAIIRTHVQFPWKKIQKLAWRSEAIEKLRADMFITFVDEGQRILDCLNTRKQWRQMNFTLENVLDWINSEVSITRDWADHQGKPFYVVPAGAPPEFLYSILFEVRSALCREMAYVSMPLTHGFDAETQAKVDVFIEKLHPYFLIFDPRYIKPLDSSKGEIFDIGRSSNIVNRDINWFLRQCKRLIAYWPSNISSPGMDREITMARLTTKEVWVIWEGKKSVSPFTLEDVQKIFFSVDECLDYVEKNFKRI